MSIASFSPQIIDELKSAFDCGHADVLAAEWESVRELNPDIPEAGSITSAASIFYIHIRNEADPWTTFETKAKFQAAIDALALANLSAEIREAARLDQSDQPQPMSDEEAERIIAAHGPMPIAVCEAMLEIYGGTAIHPSGVDFWQYYNFYKSIPGAPEPRDLTVADAPGAFAPQMFCESVDKDWATFNASRKKSEQSNIDRNSIMMPLWLSKTEDRPNMWMSSFLSADGSDSRVAKRDGDGSVMITKAFSDAFDAMLRPMSGVIIKDHVIPHPADKETMIEFVQALSALSNLLPQPMGDLEIVDVTFRLSIMITLIGGLGSGTLRHFASLQSHDPDWTAVAAMNDEELLKTITDAHFICGFPCGLLRADPMAIMDICERFQIAPSWLRAVVTCHVLKHTRRGDGVIYTAFNGRHAELLFTDANFGTDLGAANNGFLLDAISRVIGVKANVSRAQAPPPVPILVKSTFNNLHIRNLSQVRRMPLLYALDRSVHYESHHWKIDGSESFSKAPWINTGIRVTKFAALDVETGKIDHNAEATGVGVIAYPWPLGMFNHYHHATWKATLPSSVEAMLPSNFEKKYAPNIEFLGHPNGFAALRNAKAFIDLHRDDLSDTRMGAGLRFEYPIDLTVPFGNTKENTTNQNKTGLLRIRAGAIIPSIQVKVYVTSTGIPGARQFGDAIRFDGGIILDEVNKLPPNGSWFLDQTGIQGTATGSISLPGGVGEKSTREVFTLRMGLNMTSKVPYILPIDILNRSNITVLGVVTPEKTLSGQDLNDITTGKASILLRFSMIRYSHIHKILGKLRALAHPERGVGSRFPWHLAACRLFTADNSLADVTAYTEAVIRLIESNKSGAKDSGLADALGHHDNAWDVVTAFKDCSDVDLLGAFPPPAIEDKRPVYGWRAREFVDFLRSRTHGPVHLNIQKAATKLMEAVRSGYMMRDDGIHLKIIVDKGRKIEVVQIITPPSRSTSPAPSSKTNDPTKDKGPVVSTGESMGTSSPSLMAKALAEKFALSEAVEMQLAEKAAVLAREHLANVIRNIISHYSLSPLTAPNDIAQALNVATYKAIRSWEKHAIDELAGQVVRLQVRNLKEDEAEVIARASVKRVLQNVVCSVVGSSEVQSCIFNELADDVIKTVTSLIAQGETVEAQQLYKDACSSIPVLQSRPTPF